MMVHIQDMIFVFMIMMMMMMMLMMAARQVAVEAAKAAKDMAMKHNLSQAVAGLQVGCKPNQNGDTSDIYLYINIHMYMYTQIHIYIYIHIDTDTCRYTDTYTYTSIYQIGYTRYALDHPRSEML